MYVQITVIPRRPQALACTVRDGTTKLRAEGREIGQLGGELDRLAAWDGRVVGKGGGGW
jgi:hypothetical protein